jgi:cytochrome c peroxidase
MKYSGIFILIITLVILSCDQSQRKINNQPVVAGVSQEDSLLSVAQTVFKPLPVVAEDKSNVLTPEKIALGKLLYYDTRLSLKGNNSCNSCHNLTNFGVDNKANSIGDAGKHGNRNSPTVFNAALHNMQFWDGRAGSIEEQAGMPVLNSVEMAIPHKDFLMNRLSKVKLYEDKFKSAFPNDANPITYDNMQKAIGAFERTLLTPSRFDKYMEGDKNAITTQEKQGLRLFLESGCTTCHNGVGVGGNSLQKFGLITDYHTLTGSKLTDEGRKMVTSSNADKDVFKVPGLRNSKGTYPYFHDGSIARLDSAVKIMGKVQLNKELSPQEAADIVAFLTSLTGDVNENAKTFPAELRN